MTGGPPSTPEPWYAAFILRRGDQQTAVALLALAALAMAGWYVAQGGPWDTVDADRPPQHDFQFLVDVNRADWPELMQLPGVGETLARRIIEWRATHGPFASEEALGQVPGIGSKTLAALRPHLTGWADAAASPSDALESTAPARIGPPGEATR